MTPPPKKAAPAKVNLAEESKKQTSLIKEFVAGKVNLEDAAAQLGKSPATIYRYAKMMQNGEELIDRRQFGNNRKYGKKA